MDAVELNDEQESLRRTIEEGLREILRLMRSPGSSDAETASNLVKDLGKKAHRLHMSLMASGYKPRHHRYMIENRRLEPEDIKFYEHIHPLEDLLKFIADPTANDDPIDQTLNTKFSFRAYSRRWRHDDIYHLTRTKTGWNVGFMSIGGPCDQGGRPYLYENLQHDNIAYPDNLPWWFEWLWEQAHSQGLSAEAVQTALDQLSEWLRSIEGNAPSGGVWSGFSG